MKSGVCLAEFRKICTKGMLLFLLSYLGKKKTQRIGNRKIKCTEMASWGGSQGGAEVNFILAARGKKKKGLSNSYSTNLQNKVFILPSWL